MRRMYLLLAVMLVAGCSTAETPDTAPTPQEQSHKVDFGGFGPYRLGMSADEVRKAADGHLKENEPVDQDSPCQWFSDPDRQDGGLSIVVADGSVVGIAPPRYTTTTRGVAFGQDKREISHAYVDETITEVYSQVGLEVLVKENGSDNYLAFSISPDTANDHRHEGRQTRLRR